MKAADRLIDVAAAVSDGAVVDWGRVESRSEQADRDLVRRLRLLEQIAAVHAGLPPVAAFEHSLHDSLLHQAAIAGLHSADGPVRWGPLTILEKIGSGTYADVYRARDPRLDRPVALKLLRHREAGDSTAESETIEEARLLARIDHPNVVTVYGAERIDGRVGIWMEFVDGQTLEQELRDRGPFPADELVSIGTALCRALGAVHAAGLLHRDVKAQNVMRDVTGRVLLTDFGTGREVAEMAAARDLAGTPLYLAPEVLKGDAASVASDVYSLGVLLYHLATGSFPVNGRSMRDLSDAHARGAHVPLQEARPDLPARVASAIDQATSLDIGRRYESPRALETALINSTKELPSRRRARLAAVALVAILVVSGTGYLIWHRLAKAPIAFQARDWVLVTAFENRTGDEQFDGTLEHALRYELDNSSYVNVAPRERVDDALRLLGRPVTTVVDTAAGVEVARRDGGIRVVVNSAIERARGGYSVTVRVVDPRTANSLASDREEAPTVADVQRAVRRASNWLRTRLGEEPATVQEDNARLEKATTPSLRALRVYSEALHAFNQGQFPEAEALFGSALTEDPDFGSADAWMAWALRNLRRPNDEVLSYARRAVDLVGRTNEHERYWILGSYYVLSNQRELAIGQFEALARRYPDDSWGLLNLFRLYGATGQRPRAADLAVRMADARPNDFATRVRAAKEVFLARGLDAARPQHARAMNLLATAPDSVDPVLGPKSWVLMFPAHDLWIQRRPAEAAAVLEAARIRPELVAEGKWALTTLGAMYLALGQLRVAEQVFAQIDEPGQRAIVMSEVALARVDRQGVIADLSTYHGPDPVAVSLLVRAGDLGAAAQLLRTISFPDPKGAQWAADEIAEARGESQRIGDALKGDFPSGMTGAARAFLYRETLARAAIEAGDTPGAIRVLEPTQAMRENVYTPTSHSGYLWMRTQKLLADVYRQAGQIDKARAIEHELLAMLAVADDDYPLLIELKARAGS